MSEIEVEEYVRTKNGIIDKVDSLYGMIENTVHLEKQSLWFNMDYIVNHSKQLIDLIEVGDIVEIFDVLNEDVIYVWDKEMLEALKEDITNGIKIRRILTYQQYMANCYKVGEKDE